VKAPKKEEAEELNQKVGLGKPSKIADPPAMTLDHRGRPTQPKK
jgi:hypothetical protein